MFRTKFADTRQRVIKVTINLQSRRAVVQRLRQFSVCNLSAANEDNALKQAREACSLPHLSKDYMLDPYKIY